MILYYFKCNFIQLHSPFHERTSEFIVDNNHNACICLYWDINYFTFFSGCTSLFIIGYLLLNSLIA